MHVPSAQAHVLANIDRVMSLLGRYGLARPRYQLDGRECTSQINGLVVRRLITKHSSEIFRRLSAHTEQKNERIGERRPHLKSTVEIIRAALSAPQNVRGIARRNATSKALSAPPASPARR